jgi:hypothetical protein
VENDEPSNEHSKWIPTSSSSSMLVSVPEIVSSILLDSVLEPLAIVLLLPSLAELMIVSGGTVSTVQVNDAGDLSSLPELSVDLASSIWAPSARLENWAGLVQSVNDDPSMEHSKLLKAVPCWISPVDEDSTKDIELDGVTPSLTTAVPFLSTAEIIRVSGCWTDVGVSEVALDIVL